MLFDELLMKEQGLDLLPDADEMTQKKAEAFIASTNMILQPP